MAKKSPLKINESLVKRTRLTSNYTSGESSTAGEWNTDNMFNSSKQTMANRMINNEEKSLNKNNRKTKYSNVQGEELTLLQQKELELSKIIEQRTAKYGEGSDKIENRKTKRLRTQIEVLKNNDSDNPPGGDNNEDGLNTNPLFDPNVSPLDQREEGDKITPQNPLELGPPYSDQHLRDRGMDPEDYKMLIRSNKFFDPNTKQPTRDTYLPKKGKDGPPLKQLEDPQMEGLLPEVTVYDTWKTIDDNEFNKKKQDYIENFNFGLESSNRMDILGNPKWKETVRVWLKKTQENMFNAIGDGQTDVAAKWMDNARNLTNNNIKVFEGKKVNDFAKQYSDEIKGNTGGSIMSKGSHKGDLRKTDLTYMGANNINMEISEDGNIFWKMEGVDDVWSVNDLGRNVFPKNFSGALMYDDFKNKLKSMAREGSPVSKSSIKGTIESFLQNEASVLSFAHDNLNSNESMFELYEQEANKRGFDINPDPFMPESDEYDFKQVKNMVKKGLVSMAEEVYNAHLSASDIKKVKDATKNLSAKELIEKYK
tara:strand:- start:529 stop:2142 length:1614 start_codon:yes stop_codon:yes gene_type:complete